ncbi:hypothetical protein D030_3632B, partial [Vibrio parahaemolyticus AQ3810]
QVVEHQMPLERFEMLYVTQCLLGLLEDQQ